MAVGPILGYPAHGSTYKTFGVKSLRRHMLLIASISTAAFVVGGGFLTLCWIAGAGPSKTTDVADYPAVLSQWSASGLVGHFPAAIPSHASNVCFSAFPGYLQGGAHIQLRMQLPTEDVRQIEAQLRQKTAHAYAGGGFFHHYNRDQKNNLPTATFHTAGNAAKTYDFPSHYTLYVLHAKDRGCWNHGETYGTAVSAAANEVIYWAEAW